VSSATPSPDLSEQTIYFSIFTRSDCPHCIALEKFLSEKISSWSRIQPKYYPLDSNNTLFAEFTEKHNLNKVTPILLIGNEVIEWFKDEETTGKLILEASKRLETSSLFESASDSLNTNKWGAGCDVTTPCVIEKDEFLVKIPFYGVIDLKKYSLIIIASVLGFVDGFNPCAMWVLIMFLSILIQSGSRKKMIQIAGIFILAETIMYFMILNAWFKTWDFIKLDTIVTPIIGVISIGAGIFFLYEFFTNKDGECKVTSVNQKKRTIEKIKKIVEAPMSLGIFFATIGIALSVNIIEFACSIGIPQAFTKLLDMSSLTLMGKQLYIIIYTFFYMIDDFIVFGIAIYAFQFLGLTTKYSRFCLIIWGLIMLTLGYFFIFDPIALKSIIA
jgi:cytochrome c biogenesis protein CcdA/glutaredoxin